MNITVLGGDIMRNKRILVTGGAGFIGTNLCRELLNQGNEVICMDNLFTGSKKNISEFQSNSKFEFIRHDVTIPYNVEVDEIYNLACPASPVHYQYDPVKTTKTSILGAINVLDLATRLNAKVLQSSTSEVYGDPFVHPQVEEYWGNVNPIGIRSCYDEGKRCAETLFFDYSRKYDTNIKVVRIFNTYGPYMNAEDGRVVSNFIVQALEGKDITIYGSGQQTRSFCFVDDLVKGLIAMMGSNKEVKGPINLGNDGEFTIHELAEKVIKMTNSSSKIIYKDIPQDDPKQRKPDISKAKEILNWQAQIKLDEGLRKTIEYFRTCINE